MMTNAEKIASDIAMMMNGGEWKDGKWYSEGHRKAWIEAVQPYADEIERLREALRKINKATISHVNGADLLDDLHPRDEINIVVRIDGESVWHEGDWLSYLRDAVIEARSALEVKE